MNLVAEVRERTAQYRRSARELRERQIDVVTASEVARVVENVADVIDEMALEIVKRDAEIA
jgi:23S rRNA maturation mini-RNase III